MDEARHTPTPRTPGTWFVDAKAEDEFTISSDHGQIICRVLMSDDFPCLEEGTEEHMDDEARANAAFIARACNEYEGLVQALRGAATKLGAVGLVDAADDCRLAIRKAEGRP